MSSSGSLSTCATLETNTVDLNLHTTHYPLLKISNARYLILFN
jgi:hypothetical protein